MSSKKRLTYKQKSSIKFVENEDPPFIQKLKKQLGYKAPATINDKLPSTSAESTSKDGEDEEDGDLQSLNKNDGPQIVVLKEGDLNQEQLSAELEKQREEEDRQKIAEGKITFKKPLKRTQNDQKASKIDDKKARISDKAPNLNLLSFEENDD